MDFAIFQAQSFRRFENALIHPPIRPPHRNPIAASGPIEQAISRNIRDGNPLSIIDLTLHFKDNAYRDFGLRRISIGSFGKLPRRDGEPLTIAIVWHRNLFRIEFDMLWWQSERFNAIGWKR
jgi:hypothetical protein